ncbi:MAG: diguanylate cyclase [Gammaproteobacteria bacterium]|nr:diguanylate cyclase [Gammaproteobacteria bacterium]
MASLRALGFVIIALFCSRALAATISHNLATEPKEAYVLGALKLALAYSGTDTFVPTSTFLEQGRLVEELKSGAISVMWAGTQPQYEEELRPIHFPVLKGLLGYRIFIIRAGDQHRFSQVNTFDQLKRLTAGQGAFWADTEILRSAGIPVITSVKYPGLFHMLDGGRFDYFPRGAHEPWSELVNNRTLPLEVEKELCVYYPLPMYFFVARNNEALAKRIEDGLEQALTDGSFDRYFFANPTIQDVLSKANLQQRRQFRITNPSLSPQTPLDRSELWFDPSRM